MSLCRTLSVSFILAVILITNAAGNDKFHEHDFHFHGGVDGVGDIRQTLRTFDKYTEALNGGEEDVHHISEVLLPYSLSEDELWDQLNLNRVSGIKKFMSMSLENVRSAGGVTSKCMNATEGFLVGLQSGQTWALKMIDAAGKPQSSLLRDARFTWLGSFSECLEVQSSVVKDLIETPFKGQYCLAFIPLPLKTAATELFKPYIHLNSYKANKGANNLTHHQCLALYANTLLVWYSFTPEWSVTIQLNSGICVPDTCNTNDTYLLLKAAITTVATLVPQLGLNASSIPSYVWCQENEKTLDGKAIAAIVVISFIVFWVVLGTVYDVFQEYQQTHSIQGDDAGITLGLLSGEKKKPSVGLGAKLLLSFSVYTNARKILSTNQSAGSLQCVNGIRFISMTWVILGHTLALAPATPALNAVGNIGDLQIYIKRWTFQAIMNATCSVDTFFLLSGLLVAYLVLKEMEKKKGPMKMNWVMYYVHRYLRLTPPYMLVVMVYTALLTYTNSGPFWVPSDRNCPDWWWTNLLYINNFVHSSSTEMCMGWSWYLANDMQFYIIAPIFLIPLFKYSIAGSIWIFIGTLGSIITTAVMYNTAYGTPSPTPPDTWDLFYIHPWTRLSAYTVGLYVGFLLYKTNCRVKMHKALALLGWALAAFFCCSTLYGQYGVYNGHPWSLSVSSLYNSTWRFAWSLGVGWVIFACCTGYGGFVNTLLSWKGMIPLSRLTYCAYLVHPCVMQWFYYSQQTLIMLTIPNLIYYFFGHLVAAYSVAFVTTLLFESPMMGLEKAILGNFR